MCQHLNVYNVYRHRAVVFHPKQNDGPGLSLFGGRKASVDRMPAPAKRARTASVVRRASSYGPVKRSLKYGRIARGVRVESTPTFSETFYAGSLSINTGGVFGAQMSAIPQLADYSALYRTYRILKFEIMLMPSNINNTADGGNYQTIQRIAHSWDRSAEVATPASEVDVLNDNACKVDLLSKPLKLVCASPKPRVSLGIPATGGTVGVDLGRQNWLSFDDGSSIVHNGMPYWVTAASGTTGVPCYVKITFQCRDPR